jgi:uncharacterized membrane protein YgaE (UPF0421/DUF939 family)
LNKLAIDLFLYELKVYYIYIWAKLLTFLAINSFVLLVEGLAISVVLNLILIPWRERRKQNKKKKTEEEAEKSGI